MNIKTILDKKRLKEIEFRFLLIRFISAKGSIYYHNLLMHLYPGNFPEYSGFLYKEIHMMNEYCLNIIPDGNLILIKPKDIMTLDYDIDSFDKRFYWSKSFIVSCDSAMFFIDSYQKRVMDTHKQRLMMMTRHYE